MMAAEVEIVWARIEFIPEGFRRSTRVGGSVLEGGCKLNRCEGTDKVPYRVYVTLCNA